MGLAYSAPDRCVLGLLALESCLLLSEWFQSFAFNRHKGYAIVLAMAGVGAALLLMFPLVPRRGLVFRRRLQFSIRTSCWC